MRYRGFKLAGMAAVVGIAVCTVGQVAAESAGTFTATGNMVEPRARHTATLLANGKVLIAGGAANQTVELYDPATGTFAPTGGMTTIRSVSSATLLPDGRVLVVGGDADHTAYAELYDVSSGTFSRTDSKPSIGGPATLLPNGKVLVAGESTAELYDPATGSFTPAGAYAGAGLETVETATLLADGRVLLTGCTFDCRTELYDPASDTFSLTGLMKFPADIFRAAPLPNGKVLFVGTDEYPWPADVLIFDPETRQFDSVGYSNAPHEFAAATVLSDGTVFISGSQVSGGAADSAAELYTASGMPFAVAGYMVVPRFFHTATLLANGDVLLTGGYAAWPKPTASAEIYHPAALTPPLELLAILHGDTGQIVTDDNPVAAGEVLAIDCTGLIEGT